MQDTVSYLALGDSYTIGQSISYTDNYPNQIADSLHNSSIYISNPKIVARTGWTTGNLLAALDTAELHAPYNMVSLSIGVNNQYQGRSLAEYRQQFETLLQKAI